MKQPPTQLDITVVMPTFNRRALVTRALESLRTQTHWPAELIVVDDASSDGTPEVVRRWAVEHGFPVRVEVMPKNGGPAVARNRGIELAATPFVAFLDSDDEHMPQTLWQHASALAAVPEAVVSFVEGCVQTPTARHPDSLVAPRLDLARDAVAGPVVTAPGARPSELRILRDATESLLEASVIPTSGTCFRRSAALEVDLMPAGFRCGEDWLFWLRLSQKGLFVGCRDNLVVHHRHDENLTRPDAGMFTMREKMRACLALDAGQLGVKLSQAQRARVRALRDDASHAWRYHASQMPLSSYLAELAYGTRALGTGPAYLQLLENPRCLVRSLRHTARDLLAPAGAERGRA